MKKCNQLLVSAGLLALASSAQATLINFQGSADTTLGESAWTTFNTNTTYVPGGVFPNIDITAGNGLVYLDANSAGMGICSSGVTAANTDVNQLLNDGNNICGLQADGTTVPGGGADDNIDKAGETLTFKFNEAVDLNSIWLNNNHDRDYSLADDTILLNGSSYTISAAQEMDAGVLGFEILFGADGDTGIGSFFAAGDILTIGFGGTNAEQFYVSGIDVPEPGPLALLGLGLIGLYAASKKKAV